MRKSVALKIVTGIAAILVSLFVSCQEAGLGEKDTGSLKLYIAANTSRGLGAKTIDGTVTTVEVKMTSVPADLYPPKMASATFSSGGTTVSIGQVKIGTWKVEIFLNNTSGEQLYYGSDQVTINSGATTSANIEVFRTGGAAVTIIEGVPAPILTPGTPNMVAKTYQLSIDFPTGVTTNSTNYIKYTKGLDGVVPDDPLTGPTGGSFDGFDLTLNFTDTVKVKLFLGDGRSSSVQIFSYSQPYFSLAEGSYTGFKDVTLQSMRPGVTIRYTISEGEPGAEPTYEYGTLAGNNTVVELTYPTSVLRAVSYFAGDPDSISEVASATYTLNVAPKIEVYINSAKATSGSTTLSYGVTTTSGSVSKTIYVTNSGNGQDLVLPTTFLNFNGTALPYGTTFSSTDDLFSLTRVIPTGAFMDFDITFSPSGLKGLRTETMTILSNDPSTPGFNLTLTGEAYDPPTVSLLSGLLVENAGYTSVNGVYSQIANANSLPAYQLSGSNYGYVFGSGSTYFIDYSTSFSSISSASADNYSSPTVRYYRYTQQTGLSTAWTTTNGTSPAPDVTVLNGLGGKYNTTSDAAYNGYMTTSRALKVYYTVSADTAGGDTVPVTPATFKWYMYVGGNWNEISGATSQTYTPTVVASGTQYKVVVTPISGKGLIGTSQYSTITAP